MGKLKAEDRNGPSQPIHENASLETLPSAESTPPWVSSLLVYMERLDAKVTELLQQKIVKDWYGTDEVAQILGKSEYTVREWCRNDRVHAEKKGSGRGKYQSWVVSHEELLRIQKEGLLLIRKS